MMRLAQLNLRARGPMCLLPVLAGALMLGSSLRPWLHDPLGVDYTAWGIAVRLGWPLHSPIFSYGLLCLGCALWCCAIAVARWRRGARAIRADRLLLVGFCCLLPVVLFCFQYQCVDLAEVSTLVQHKIQALLIQQHFGYKTDTDLYQGQPLLFSDTHALGRFQVFVNQLGNGLFLPLLSAGLLFSEHYLLIVAGGTTSNRSRRRLWLLLAYLFCGLLFFGRAPAALACDFQAKEQLAMGRFAQALNWLDAAAMLNPEFTRVAYYHIQRGQAWYFLHPQQENADTHVYLASVYREQGNNVGAYQELLASQSARGQLPTWATSEFNITMIDLTETVQRQNGPPVQRINFDATVIPWLDKLLLVDPTNAYGHYVLGRIQYELHNYDSCITQMSTVLKQSESSDIRSSAYTYMALSLQGQGNLSVARQLLLKAVELDPTYRNNTAREELSGLH